MIYSALITMLTYSNANTSSALGLKKNPSNTTMVIKAKNIVVAIVTFTNLSDAMSAGEVVLDRNCFLNFILQTVPQVLTFVSQWLKVAQAFQRFIILYKPIKYKMIFNARSVTVFLIVIVIALGSLLTKSILSINFERVVIIDRTSMENVEICRKPGFFSPESQFPSINNVTVDSILPKLYNVINPNFLI
jgi:hypothetical protein